MTIEHAPLLAAKGLHGYLCWLQPSRFEPVRYNENVWGKGVILLPLKFWLEELGFDGYSPGIDCQCGGDPGSSDNQLFLEEVGKRT